MDRGSVLVFTARHHAGYSMLTVHCIMQRSPFGRTGGHIGGGAS